MAPSDTRIIWDRNPISANLRDLPAKIDRGIQAIMEFKATDVQNYARTNAPWTDRTSNARNGLFADTFGGGPGRDVRGRFTSGRTRGIVLSHSVPYGIWLEVRFSGRYAIIMPTIETKAPEVFALCHKMLGRI